MVIESAIAEAAIETNIKPFLSVLAVALGVATLPQIFSRFRQIPHTLLSVWDWRLWMFASWNYSRFLVKVASVTDTAMYQRQRLF